MKIAEKNVLIVSRLVDFGAYLVDEDGKEVLLPGRYISKPLKVGAEVSVVVYTDSEDRIVASTDMPLAFAGEFAFLDVVDVGPLGAFLDWGLPKDLLVPYKEQKSRMIKGGRYLVYIYVDKATGRPVASAKIGRFLGKKSAEYADGEKVEALVFERNDIGYRCIVNNSHAGILYVDQVYKPLKVGDRLTAYVRRVRPDGKLDLSVGGRADVRTAALAKRIVSEIHSSGGSLGISDKSEPAEIALRFNCSKKDFKKAVGHLLKAGEISMSSDKTILFIKK